MDTGLYIHVPYCVRKCLYCDFYSLPTGKGPIARRLTTHEPHDASLFLDALASEMDALPKDFRPTTIFMGGGTPTELADADFDRLLREIRQRFDMSEIHEWTCESNPGTLTRHKADLMREAGINRVSLGVQSFDAAALEFLGRIHTAAEAEAGYHLLRDAGFTNINLDLIYGIPGSRPEALAEDLQRLQALAPEHTACYCLIFEDGTPLAELRAQGFVKEVDDETELEQYRHVCERLTQSGFEHYEISNFAKPGKQCAHNLLYWGAGEYLGCGPSAHSHWRGQRFGNLRDLETYCARWLGGKNAQSFCETLPAEAKARETLVMALRRRRGISRDEFRSWTGLELEPVCGEKLPWLCAEGLLELRGEHLRLTDRGLFVSDAVFAELV